MMKNKNHILKFFSVIMMIGLFLIFKTAEVKPVDDHEEISLLAEKTRQAYDLIRLEKEKMNLDISNHKSGMMGPELTGITTTLGSKESKGTGINPDFIGVIYDYVKTLNLQSGDFVAVNLSSSFPSLNIQTMLTLEHLDLNPIVITSLGASTYGATDPELTYLDMEHLLIQNDIIKHKSVFYSLGGDYDIGNNMDADILPSIINRLEIKGYDLYSNRDLESNLQHRMKVYKNTKALINVGGNTVSETEAELGYFTHYGYLHAGKIVNYNGAGLIGEFLSSGRDVVHLLNIKDIAVDYQMPIDPEYRGKIDKANVYFKVSYHILYAYCMIVIFIVGLVTYGIRKKQEVKKTIQDLFEQ